MRLPCHWAAQLRQEETNDTIISFNYDRVLETLVSENPDLHFKTGGDCEPLPFVTDVLKLHGSVDWRWTEHTTLEIQENEPYFALNANDNELAIATPGPRKQSTVTDMFEPLWLLAEQQLQEAHAIVFLGYRFPPTDAQARQRILRAVRRGSAERDVEFHIVLGPDTNSPDVSRLAGLLEATRRNPGGARSLGRLGRSVIHRHAMYAEDFLSVYDAKRFAQHYKSDSPT
ncbi:MAG: SIR2 family protein [Planctomycetaceae bacterium]|nr:SIR2 family protein [Planctomycetaceae bacterium]